VPSWDGTVRIWDVTTGDEHAVLTGHAGVFAVAVTPDGSWLASGGGDGTVRIWDTATWQARALMRVDSEIWACGWLTCPAWGARGEGGGGQGGRCGYGEVGVPRPAR
jgi:WD40 repeat protein